MKYEELKSRFDALDGEVQKYIRDYPEEKDIADLWGQVHSSFGNYTSRKFPELQVTTGAAPREQQPIETLREHPDTPTGAGGGYDAPILATKTAKEEWPITPEKDSIGTPLNKTFNMIAQLPGQVIKMTPAVIALLARQGLTGQPGNTMPSNPRERSASAYNAVKPTTDRISGNYSKWVDEYVPYDKPTGKYAKPAKSLLPKDFNAPIFINTPNGPIDVSPAVKALATENLTDPKRAYKTIVENSGTMTVFAAASFANPVFGFALMASAEGAETANTIDEYQAMTGKQVDPDLRAVLEMSTATVNGLLEKVGLDTIIKTGRVPGLSKKISQAIVAHLTEGTQEGLQEVTQILAESGYNNEARKWSEQIPRISESFYGGLIAAIPATSIAGIAGHLSEKQGKNQGKTGDGGSTIPPESGATVQPETEPAAQPEAEPQKQEVSIDNLQKESIPTSQLPARTSKSALPKAERKQEQAGARLLDEFQQEDATTQKSLQQRIAAALAQAKQKREAEQPKPVSAITVEPKPAPQPKPLPTKITGDVKLDARIRKAVGKKAEPKPEPKVIDEDTFLAINGAGRNEMGESALHKNIQEGKAKRDMLKRQSKKDWEIIEKRDKLRKEYKDKVASGEIRPPTRLENLHETANGNEDNEAVQAARRLLEKKGIDWKKPLEQQPPTPTPEPAAKPEREPWEMTRGEYLKIATSLKRNPVIEKQFREDYPVELTEKTADKIYHEYEIKQALASGKPVPPEVLADYPDLMPKGKAANPEQTDEMTKQEVVAGLEAKQFYGTIDRLNRGEIDLEQAHGELLGTKKPKVIEQKPISPADYANTLKAQGVDRKTSWTKWIQQTYLKPGMDAKDWYKIYDSVSGYAEPAEQPAQPEQGEPKEPEKMTQEDYDYYVMKPFRDEVESINEQLKKLDRTPRSKNVNIRIKRIHQESDLKDRLAELEKNRPISQYKVMMSALQENKTVNAVALDKWGITKYEGYVREGDLYVYNPEKAKQQTEQPIEEKKEPENEPIRTINIPGRGIIEVKGTGAATYWRDPSAGMRSPFGSNFVLASPEFRDEIEKASGDELQQAIDTYNAANEKYRKSHYDEKARENYRNAKNDLQEKVNNEIIKRLPDDADFDASTIQNFYDKLGREEVDRIIERTVEEATANYEAEKEKTERTTKAFADRKDEYLKAATVKDRQNIFNVVKDFGDNQKNIGWFGEFPIQTFKNKFDTKQKPADVLFKNNIVFDDAGMPALTGVFHSESGDLVATDGHAMVVIHNKSDKSGKIRLDDGLEAAGDLRYPNYEVVMPKKPETLGVVDVEEMLNIGKSADKLRTKDDYPMVRIGEQRYNSNYVKRIASVLYELGIKKANVLQGEKGNFGPGPILFKDAKGKVTALLMPINGNVDKVNYTVTITSAPKQSTSSPGSEAEMGGVQAAPGGFNIPTSSAPVSGEPISTGEVVRRIGRAFNVPIRLGRFNRPFAGGIYKQLEKVARIKGYGNIAVAAHEVAHHMDHTSNVLQNLPSAVMLDELRNLDYSPKQRRKSEGFAEFMRHYLTDGEAQLHAPDFYQYFENVWLPNSQWAAAVRNAKAAVDQWRNQGFSNRIGAQISFNVSRWGRLKKYLGQPKTIIHAIGDAMFNRLGPMVRVSREMTGQRDVLTAMPADVNFWAFAKVANMAASAKARNAAKYGMIDVAGNRVGPGLIEIMAPVAEQMKDPNTLLDFYKYLYARHAIDVITQGKDPGITLQDAQDGVAMWGGRPGWQQAADGITNWHSQLIDYLVDAGGLTQEAADLMREMYPNYISLARDMEIETPMPRGTGGAKMANLPNPIKRLKGSKRPIIPPMETALTYAERLIGLADKIRVGKMMVNAAKQYGMLGRVVEKVDPDLVPHSMSLDNLKSQLTALGADLNNADMDGMLTMFEQSFFGDPKDRVLTFFENGKRQVYQIGEEYDALYRAFVAMDKPAKLPRIIDLTFGTASRAMRLGATGIRAGFSLVTNPIRDIHTAVMQSEAQTANPASIALHSVGGVIKDLSNNEVARLWKTGGGEMAQPLGIDRRFAQEMIQEVLSQDPKSKVLNWAKHPVDSIRGLFSIPEAGPRIAEFEAELKRLGWQPGRKLTFEQYVKAQLKAANVTVDFREGGSFSMWINQIVPFFNVGFQGPNRMYDKMTRKPVQTTAAGIMWITLPTLALWFMYKDDDWFKNLPPYERWRYWHLKLTGTIIRIPKPFEWGHLFGSIPEAAVDAAYRKDPQAIDDAMGIIGKDLLPSIIPAAVDPAAEVAFDYDIYRGRRLIPQSLQKYNPEDQAAQYTTETAKKIGKLFNVPPIYVDHLVEGYTGGLGTDIISGAEYAARGVGALPGKGVRPKELSDIPVVGRLLLRPNATRMFDDFYSRLEKLKQETSSTKLRGEPVNPDKAAKLKKMNKVALKLAAKRKEIRNIVSDTKMSEDDKRIKIVAINKEMEEMAGTQVKELKALKEKLARMGIKTRF